MTEIGLTGNIGSGKTTVCHIFESLGVPVFYSDIEAKKLYRHPEVKEQIWQTLGKTVFNTKQEIDFKKLASVIFNDKASLDFINKLIHPLVFESYKKWKNRNAGAPCLIHESAILFEHHLETRFQKTIVVYCPEDIRIKRVTERDKIPEKEVRRRINTQMNDDIKNSLADYVIRNDGKEMLIPQIMKLYRELCC